MSDGRPRNVAVLGSTGSVGTQALEVLRTMADAFRVVGLASNTRWQDLAAQVLEFAPRVAVIGDGRHAADLSRAVDGCDVQVLTGSDGLQEAARWPEADLVLSAVSGSAGLPAAIAALEGGKTLALANKEALVMAGPLLTRLAERSGATILPVDSEHSALFQLLQGVESGHVAEIVLTASGGPFYGWSRERMEAVTPRQALEHPTWRMGRKITVDSATLFNKALEVIEARWLFGLPPERIRVLIHPQSIVHGMVRLLDGSVLAHMGVPDMRMPIRYALNYPRRSPTKWGGLDLAEVGTLEFGEPDRQAFPALELGFRVAAEGGTSGAVLNAANERAVRAFLAGRMRFTDIVKLVGKVLDRHEVDPEPDFERIAAAHRWAREEAESCLDLLSTRC